VADTSDGGGDAGIDDDAGQDTTDGGTDGGP
jgi:hypothetical protein